MFPVLKVHFQHHGYIAGWSKPTTRILNYQYLLCMSMINMTISYMAKKVVVTFDIYYGVQGRCLLKVKQLQKMDFRWQKTNR